MDFGLPHSFQVPLAPEAKAVFLPADDRNDEYGNGRRQIEARVKSVHVVGAPVVDRLVERGGNTANPIVVDRERARRVQRRSVGVPGQTVIPESSYVPRNAKEAVSLEEELRKLESQTGD